MMNFPSRINVDQVSGNYGGFPEPTSALDNTLGRQSQQPMATGFYVHDTNPIIHNSEYSMLDPRQPQITSIITHPQQIQKHQSEGVLFPIGDNQIDNKPIKNIHSPADSSIIQFNDSNLRIDERTNVDSKYNYEHKD